LSQAFGLVPLVEADIPHLTPMQMLRASGRLSIFFAGLIMCHALGTEVDGSATRSSLSPVTRVVQLLKNLASKIEDEIKTEENLYETFVCWGKSVISSKSESNAKAGSRVDTLNTYIADLDAGRIELTSERADLTKQIKGLHSDLERAKQIRGIQHEDFLDAEEEMSKAIQALESALAVLHDATGGRNATGGHNTTLLAVNSKIRQAFSVGVAEGESISRAVELGREYLAKSDAIFLERLFNGEVPTVDWKKLNRKATFKTSYHARSTKIIAVLTELEATFKSNLEDARSKEAADLALYNELSGAKQKQLESAQGALATMEKETGARGLSRSEASEEVESLDEQVRNDNGYIQQVQQSMSTKKQGWKTRKDLRLEEIEAINQAIAILHNDDARDLFKRSFHSQGYVFLQTSEGNAIAYARSRIAGAELRKAARSAHDVRLMNLAIRVSASPIHFEVVINHIDSMVATLRSEENTDLATKEDCERDRAADAREAVKYAREIDESSDLITRLKAEIQELEAQIKAAEQELQEIRDEDARATEIRDGEHKAWEATDADDAEAAVFVQQAKEVLQKFYEDNNLMLTQVGVRQPEVSAAVVAGQAPPPPPATWEGPYKGKIGESTGILSILAMIQEDILKDQRKAKAEEDEALQQYNKAHALFVLQEGQILDSISTYKGRKGTKETGISDEKGTRKTTKDQLDAVVGKIKKAEPGCDFAAINYSVRASNRQIEIDGLLKAKAILQGAVFSEIDDNRPLKPGDALLLQRRHRVGQ